MSCHYSCSTCSTQYYYDVCLTCPSTRSLLANTCPCSLGYYEYQQSQCTSLSSRDSFFINVANVAFYVAIALQYLIIVLTLNRILSIKLKKIIDTCQVIALISYYRFAQTSVATSALKIMDAFNFSYLNKLICTQQSPPYGCATFQNLFGVGFSIIIFFFLFILSYFIGYFIYSAHTNDDEVIHIKDGKQMRGGVDNSLGFMVYWQSLYPSLFLLYLDQTAIQTALSISRIAIANYVGVIILIPFLILIILVVRVHFTTINDPKQTTLAYRAIHSYFYYYDEYYHFAYIDHVFQDQNANQNVGSLKKPFYPQSNLIIMEILFKIFLGASTIVFYQYSPYLFALCCIFLLVVYSCIMKIFFTYQLFDLWFYYSLIGVQVFSIVSFSSSYFFQYFIMAVAVALQLLAIMFIVASICSWRREKEGEMFKKTFELVKSYKISNLEQSQDQLESNKKPNQEEVEPFQNINENNLLQSLSNQNQSSPHRAISQRNISQKPQNLNNSIISKKQTDSILPSNFNTSMPVRRISRRTNLKQQSLKQQSNPALLNTISESAKGEESVVKKGNNSKKTANNIFLPQDIVE